MTTTQQRNVLIRSVRKKKYRQSLITFAVKETKEPTVMVSTIAPDQYIIDLVFKRRVLRSVEALRKHEQLLALEVFNRQKAFDIASLGNSLLRSVEKRPVSEKLH